MPDEGNLKSTGSFHTSKEAQNGLKKIIKEKKSIHSENITLTTGRCKKVQFNTLPELTRPKINNKNKSIFAEILENEVRENSTKSNKRDFLTNSETNCEHGEYLCSRNFAHILNL